MSGFDLLVAGRPSVDVMFSGLHGWPELGNDVDADGLGVCAGTAFNTPAAATRLGMRVAFVATIGNDAWSEIIRTEWDHEGLPTDFRLVEDRPLPGVSVALNHDGDRGFVTHWGADGWYDDALRARAHDVARSVDARHVHAHVDDDRELESIARERGMTISLDTWGGPWFASERPLEELLANADVLFANERESLAMTGEREIERALERLGEHCPVVAIKLGARGAIGYSGGVAISVAADPVDVVDTTGAGDCFDAGFLLGWLGGLGLEESLTLGVIVGTRAVTDYGGYRACPELPELRALARERGVVLEERVG